MMSTKFHPWRRIAAALLALMLVTGGVATVAAAPAATQVETKLAVVRAGGAPLVDSSGSTIRQLATGTALTASGRSADDRWVFVSTAEGLRGWAPVDRLLLFGLEYLPVLEGFQEPVASAPPVEGDAGSTAEVVTAQGTPSAPVAGQPASVNTARLRLNVRSGPGLRYPVIGKVNPGQVVSAIGRNQAGDWIQIEQAGLTDGFGWVSAPYLDIGGVAADLAVSDAVSAAPALPTARRSSSGNTGLSGTLVFQERSGGKIFVHDLAGGSTRTLTNGADPAISPDGRQVAFWRDEEGQHRLFVVDIDGSNERPILTRGEMIRSPSWSPDGQRIVFARVTGEAACRNAGWGICLPDTFPYNTMFPLKMLDEWGLSSVDRQGGDFQDLVSLTSSNSPSWDEQGIVYSSAGGIQLTSDDHDAETRAIVDEYRFRDPALQPGGNRVVFQSLEKDHWEIFTATDDGANVTALTRPATTLISPLPHNVAPVWSPDGRTILFLSNRSGDWAFWAMNADGSDQRRLSIDEPIEYHYQNEQVASWGR